MATYWTRAPGNIEPRGTSISELVEAAQGGEDRFLIIHLDFLDPQLPIRLGDSSRKGLRAVGNYISQDDTARRVGVFNLSARLRSLRRALAKDQ